MSCFPMILSVIIFCSLICLLFFLSGRSLPSVTEQFSKGDDLFYLYNYYREPVDIKIIVKGASQTEEQLLFSKVVNGRREGVDRSTASKLLRDGSTIKIYSSKFGLIGQGILQLAIDKTIKALHVGLLSGHEDLTMAGEGTKSTLGTAISRLNLINVTPRTINLSIGSDQVMIPSNSSVLYYGPGRAGLHFGVTIRDQDQLLQNYIIDRPITDLYLGLISDAQTPLYNGSKFGRDFDDTINITTSSLCKGETHKGALIDRLALYS